MQTQHRFDLAEKNGSWLSYYGRVAEAGLALAGFESFANAPSPSAGSAIR